VRPPLMVKVIVMGGDSEMGDGYLVSLKSCEIYQTVPDFYKLLLLIR